MKQVVQNDRSRALQILEVPEPRARTGAVAVRNAVSLISTGTERMAVEFGQKSLLEKARARPDLVRQVVGRVQKEGLRPTVEAVLGRLDQPVPLGYSCAGTVAEIGHGVDEFEVGQRVACAGAAYAHHAEVVVVPRNLVVPIPENVSFEDAAYVTLGAIALHGVRTADVRVGDSVAVIGLGLLGQLSLQLLRAAGCRTLAIDLDESKVALARKLGAEVAVRRTDEVAAAVAEFTRGQGVDAVIVAAATTSNDPLELAGEICRDRGRVSVVGAVGMAVPRETYYRKELELRLSRSYGPGRYDPQYEEKGQDYPIGYVRWTERRNMAEFLRLIASGQVSASALTTHRFAIEDAARAYELVTGKNTEEHLGIALEYRADAPAKRTVALRPAAPASGRVRLGMIGAGSFGKSVLLPRLAARADLVGIATANGVTARATADRFKFQYCTTEAQRLLADESIEALVIATRHGSHARYVADALRAGKSVFVEKPLALDEPGLQQVLEAQAETGRVLCVGFNRRFSPLSERTKAAFAHAGPLAINYRVNAGPLPREHWLHDPEDGGGRIIGEGCHFIDLIQYLTGELPVEVAAFALGGEAQPPGDTVAVTIRLSGGSVANLSYFSSGDRAYPKEQVEVFGGGVVAVLDDFRRLVISASGRRSETKPRQQEKGFDQEIEAFLAAVRGNGPLPIGVESLAATTRATFAIMDSLKSGKTSLVS